VFPFNKLRLRTQITFFFLLQIGLLLSVSGVYVNWQLRRVVERELGERLVALARLAATQVAETPVLALLPGDEQSRTALRLRREFDSFVTLGGLSRLLIADAQQRIYFDSRSEIAIGSEYVRLRFDAAEISRAMAGEPTAAPLFYDHAGQPFKAAYAPLSPGQAGVICVEASAASLVAVRETRNMLLTIGGLAIVAAALSAGALSRQVTRPLEKLKLAAEATGRGDYKTPVEKSGSSEVAFLAQTIEDMRRAVIERQQRQQMMLAGIAHEIRNPLGGIELFAGLLQKKCPPSLQPDIDKILHEVQQLKKIVQDFLEYARPSPPQRRQVRLAAAVDETRELLGNLSEGIDWQLDVAKALTVEVDADHLRRMLLNLLRNACEAVAEQNARGINIVGTPRDKNIDLVIQDNGPGIAAEHRDKIFEPFFTTRHHGTGLGLALVKLLAEENGGRVELLNGEQGAAFRLSLRKG
jgi:signal transduction histidine kinase